MIGARAAPAGLVAAIVLMALTGCTMWGPEGGPGGSGLKGPPTATTEPAVDATADRDGVQHVDIDAGDNLRFTPAMVRARAGVLELVFHNVGTVPHDVEVEVGAASGAPGSVDNGDPGTGNLNGGQSATVRITLSKPGRYPFVCTYHVSSGMQGTIQIV